MQTGERLSLLFKLALPFLLLWALQAYPVSYAVVDNLREAQIARQEDRPVEAADALRRVLAQQTWRTQLWEEIAWQEHAAGRFDQAVYAFQRADQAGVLSADGRFQLAEDLFQIGDAPAAEAVLQDLLRMEGPADRIYDRLAQFQRARRDYAAAVQTLRAWHEFAPQDAQVAFKLGMYLMVLDPEEALPLLLEASSKNSNLTPAVQTLRFGLGQAGNTDEPAYGWLMIGRVLGSIDQWDLAAEAFQKSLSLSADYGEAWAFLSEALYHVDGSGKAELDQALKLAPESAVVRALAALYWRRAGEPQKALEYLLAIAAQEPDEPVWKVEIAYAYVATGDLMTARDYFEQAINLAPESSLYWQYLARFSAEYQVEPSTLGLPAARKAILLAPDDPAALDTMGMVMMRLGDSASAERFLQRALHSDANYAQAYLHLGQLYLQQDFRRAYPYLKRAAELAGKSPTGVTARRLLLQYFDEGG